MEVDSSTWTPFQQVEEQNSRAEMEKSWWRRNRVSGRRTQQVEVKQSKWKKNTARHLSVFLAFADEAVCSQCIARLKRYSSNSYSCQTMNPGPQAEQMHC